MFLVSCLNYPNFPIIQFDISELCGIVLIGRVPSLENLLDLSTISHWPCANYLCPTVRRSSFTSTPVPSSYFKRLFGFCSFGFFLCPVLSIFILHVYFLQATSQNRNNEHIFSFFFFFFISSVKNPDFLHQISHVRTSDPRIICGEVSLSGKVKLHFIKL